MATRSRAGRARRSKKPTVGREAKAAIDKKQPAGAATCFTSALAIDLASHKAGMAFWSVSPVVHRACETWDFGELPHRERGPLLTALRARLVLALDVYQPVAVGLEVVKHQGSNARRTWHAMAGVIEEECALRQITLLEVWPPTWKLYLTGKGNATKPACLKVVQALGFPARNHDEGDASGVLVWTMGRLPQLQLALEEAA